MRLYHLPLIALLLPIGLAAANLEVTPAFTPRDVIPEAENGLSSGYISAPGLPRLPVRAINVLLPKDAAVNSWSFSITGESFLPAPPPQTNAGFSDGERVLSAPTRDIGQQRCVYLGTRQWGELRYAAFNVLPAVYDAVRGAYSLAQGVSIRLDYSTDEGKNAAKGIIPASYREADPSRKFFSDPAALDAWYAPSTAKDYDILVVSTPQLYSALSAWETFRAGQGFATSFASIAAILASSPGANGAEKLRNYVISQYNQHSFSYLLLVGDYDTVPTAYLNPEPDGGETVPSDFYFSDLSSIFDTDTDGRLGEYSTGIGDQDYLVDFTPEVFVGRISTNSPAEVSAIAQRIVSFEQDNGAWKNSALLPAAFLNYQGEPETIFLQTDGAGFMEYAKATVLHDMDCSTMYEHTGVVPSYPSDYDLSYDTLAGLLSTQSYGLLNWSAHGSATSSSRKVWMNDANQNQLPDSWEMDWMGMVNRDSFNNLANQTGMVIFAASCYNGMIDNDSASLAEYSLIKKGVAVLGATRTGWYKIGWENPGWGGLSSYNLHFLENYVTNGMSVGAAHAYANLLHTQYYMFGDPVDSGGIIYPELQNVYTYMLFGDPLIGHTAAQEHTLGEILVWEPQSSEGLAVVNAINASGRYNVVYTDKLIPDYSYIDRFEAVFCLFGWGDIAYSLAPGSLEYNLLNGYLDGGGKMWMEGMLPWEPSDPFWGKFGTHAPLDVIVPIGSIHYQHAGESTFWPYSVPDVYTQPLLPAMASAVPLFTNFHPDQPAYTLGFFNTNGSYRSVAASFQLAKVADGDPSLADLLTVICDTLGIGYHPPVDADDPVAVPTVRISSHPNPFSESCRISLDIEKAAQASIDIYNIRGQRIRRLARGVLAKGTHIFSWDGRDDNGRGVASGIYTVRLNARGNSRSARLILIK